MFERWKLADKLLGGPVAQTIDYRVDGRSRIFEIAPDEGSDGRFCTQQMLVTNLLKELIDVRKADVRFGVTDIAIRNEPGERPSVNGIVCDHIVGCDGDRGVSRRSIPDGVITTYTHEFGYAWLAALVEAPLVGHPLMGVSTHGFVAQLPRGPQRSRYYLQCALGDGPADWPDERLWDEIRLRVGDPARPNAVVHDKLFVPLRSVVHTPIQHRPLSRRRCGAPRPAGEREGDEPGALRRSTSSRARSCARTAAIGPRSTAIPMPCFRACGSTRTSACG